MAIQDITAAALAEGMQIGGAGTEEKEAECWTAGEAKECCWVRRYGVCRSKLLSSSLVMRAWEESGCGVAKPKRVGYLQSVHIEV